MINFKTELKTELCENILPFWINNVVDKENGGFYGYISRDMEIKKEYVKSGVINARILWTFSRCFRKYRENIYLCMANKAYEYIEKYFLDRKNGGIYWLVNFKGEVVESKKQVYAQAFTIYALAEYYDITSSKKVLDKAFEIFDILEKRCKDLKNGGYYDAFSEGWGELDDTSLSESDMNCSKTMNTNLHIMEAYSNLYRVSKSLKVKNALEEIVNVCIKNILDKEKMNFSLYFDEKWKRLSNKNSFGHDIEGSWLLCEAVDFLDNVELKKKVYEIAVKMCENVYKYGLNPNGGIYEEACDSKIVSENTQWWVFAEAVIGFFNAYQISHNNVYLEKSKEIWEFIKNNIVDKKNGDWYWGISDNGKILGDEKVSSWKCPYHNSRMCIEIIERIERGI